MSGSWTFTPRRLQFNLRFVLIVLAGVSVWLAAMANQAHRQGEAIHEIEGLGGTVFYDYQNVLRTKQAIPVGGPRYDRSIQPPSNWRRTFMGEDFFRTVEVVDLRATNATERQIASFQRALPRAAIECPTSRKRRSPSSGVIAPTAGRFHGNPLTVAFSLIWCGFFGWLFLLCLRRFRLS